MHTSVLNFCRKILTAERVNGKRVLEVGSFNVNGSVRDFVTTLLPAAYVGVDITPQEGYVDHVMDACGLLDKFGPESWDVVISTEMLEHASDWESAVRNMKGVLRHGGIFLLTARGPGFPLHNHPSDHWRFTTDDVASMCSDFATLYLAEDHQDPGFLYAGVKGRALLPPPCPSALIIPYHSSEAFDERMRLRRSPNSVLPFPLRAFYHIACLGNWKEVVAEQCADLRKVGIRPTAFALGSAEDVAWLAQHALDVAGYSENLSEYETPTLALLDRWCEDNPDGAVMYLHTKGVSQPTDANKIAWRRLMMHYVVRGVRDNLSKLKVADMVGVDWQHSPNYPHFAGNFWMARADWINSLPDVEAYKADGGPWLAGHPWERMHAEMWLGSRPWHHIESLCCTNTSLWRGDDVFKLLAAVDSK